MGICNLRHIDEEIWKRKAVVEHYRSRLQGVPGIKLCAEQAEVTPNYAYFPVVFDGYKYTRDEVFARLAQEQIIARKYFFPLTNDIDCYRQLPGAGTEKTPVAKHVADSVLTLPLYADLTIEEVDKICDIILA
jgi:dTDP-4-amino-4,6-dideoxygalactose transaminase